MAWLSSGRCEIGRCSTIQVGKGSPSITQALSYTRQVCQSLHLPSSASIAVVRMLSSYCSDCETIVYCGYAADSTPSATPSIQRKGLKDIRPGTCML